MSHRCIFVCMRSVKQDVVNFPFFKSAIIWLPRCFFFPLQFEACKMIRKEVSYPFSESPQLVP